MRSAVYLLGVAAAAWLASLVYPGSFDSGSFVGAVMISVGLMVALFLITAFAGGAPGRPATLAWSALLALLVIVPGTREAYERRADDPAIDGFWSYLEVRAREGHDAGGIGDRGRVLMWIGFLEHWLFPLAACLWLAWMITEDEEEEDVPDRSHVAAGTGGGGHGSGHGSPRGSVRTEYGTVSTDDPGALEQALHAAVNQNRPHEVGPLLDAGAPRDGLDPFREPYAFLAARLSHPDALVAFLDRGFDPTTRGPVGRTLLHTAAADDDRVFLIPRLLEAGVEVDATTDYGETPLMTAHGCLCAPAIDALLAAGADPLRRDENGKSVLHRLVSGSGSAWRGDPSEERARRITDLTRFGVDATAVDRYGWTAADQAAAKGRTRAVETLLDLGLVPLEADPAGPLFRAAMSDHDETVRRLVDAGVEMDFWSAVLLDDRTWVEVWLRRQPGLITAVLLKPRTNALGLALWKEHLDLAWRLLERGADPRGPGFHDTPLVQALRAECSIRFIRRLLERGAAEVVDRGDGNGATPLHLAAGRDDRELVRLLLDHGADPNAWTHRGATVLDSARSEAVREMLLRAGARG